MEADHGRLLIRRSVTPLSNAHFGRLFFYMEKYLIDLNKAKLLAGKCYSRHEILARLNNNKYLLNRLIESRYIKRAYRGIYYRPKVSRWGELAPDDSLLIKCFLSSDKFVLYSPGIFNSLGLGTTQLYNCVWVINTKKSGKFKLGWKEFDFFKWNDAPKKLSFEFLVVEILNKIDYLAEDKNMIYRNLKKKLPSYNKSKILKAAKKYGIKSTQKWLFDNYLDLN